MLRSGVCAAFSALLLSAAPVFAQDPGKSTDWTGLYIGAHGGYGWADADGVLTTSAGCAGTCPDAGYTKPNRSVSDDGWLGGFQAGYNAQLHGLVVGLEGDISWAEIDATGTFDTDKYNPSVWSKKHDISLDHFGTVRLRVGVPVGHVLPYVTGGLAWGKTNAELAVKYTPPPGQAGGGTSYASADETHVGWTVGGGFEWKLASNWSFKAEYLHIDLGKEDYAFKGTTYLATPFNTDSFPADLTLDTVRVGLNYHFGGRDELVPLK